MTAGADDRDYEISRRFAAACVYAAKRPLRKFPAFLDCVVRACVVLDLTEFDVFDPDTRVTFVDPTPVAWECADSILDYVAQHPQITLDKVLAYAPVQLRDVVRDLLPEGTWYESFVAERRRLHRADTGRADSKHTAVVRLIADSASAFVRLPYLEPEVREALFAQCANLESMTRECTAYLKWMSKQFHSGTWFV
jgi:hypothetical protein